MQPDKRDSGCECFYTACSAVALVLGVWLITTGAWWGWPIAACGVIGLLVAAIFPE